MCLGQAASETRRQCGPKGKQERGDKKSQEGEYSKKALSFATRSLADPPPKRFNKPYDIVELF